jgi:hypothetical protein
MTEATATAARQQPRGEGDATPPGGDENGMAAKRAHARAKNTLFDKSELRAEAARSDHRDNQDAGIVTTCMSSRAPTPREDRMTELAGQSRTRSHSTTRGRYYQCDLSATMFGTLIVE